MTPRVKSIWMAEGISPLDNHPMLTTHPPNITIARWDHLLAASVATGARKKSNSYMRVS